VGINREELVRLAKLRVPVSHFNTAKLSKNGYLVKLEDQDVKLPCELGLVILFQALMIYVLLAGEVVSDGTDFRNSAHLRFKADLFVPCGGRCVVSLISQRTSVRKFHADRRLSTSPIWRHSLILRENLTSNISSKARTCSSPNRHVCTWRNVRSSSSRIQVLTRVRILDPFSIALEVFIHLHRWCNKFVSGGSRRSGVVDSRIPRSYGLQKRQTF